MPNLSGSPSPFQLPFPGLPQLTMAPWFFGAPAAQAATSATDALNAAPGWGQALETQLRLWSQMVDVQRKFWSFYTPLLERTPMSLNGVTKTVAEDEQGMEPAETADGIPDPFELQMRTWNHFIDAHRNF